ncbi:MAG TPA: energy transducer TonB [Blastocatellia bacterium]|nr:energy transducer TonB [Blastocatellia bacterium]
MNPLPRGAALLSIIFFLATADLAQTSPPPPAPRVRISDDIPDEAWQEFKHEAGNFAVAMPVKPLEISQTIEGDVGKVPTKSFVANSGQITFVVMYADYPITFDAPEAVNASLDVMRDLLLSKGRGKLISEKEHLFKKYTGRELRAGMDDGMARVRMYLIQQRLYMLTVIFAGANDVKQLESKQVVRFLDSFQLIEEPKAAPANMASMSGLKLALGNLELPPDFLNRPVSWLEVPSPDLGFTVWMPSEPFTRKIPFNPNDPRLDIQHWMARGEGAVCQLLVQPLLSAPKDEALQVALFKSWLNSIIRAGMKLELEKKIGFEGHPGREYILRGNAGIGIVRAYIIGSNIYFMYGLVLKNEKGTEEVSRFFDSFRLTKAPNSAPAIGSVIAESALWREVSEPEGGFKVSLPGEPKKEVGVMTYTLTAAGDGIACIVSRDQPPEELYSQWKKGDFYKSYANIIVESLSVEITGETNIVVDGRQWREYALKKGGLTGAIRVLLNGRDFYSIFAFRLHPGVDQKTISRLFDSFKLIEKSPKDKIAGPPPPPKPLPVPKDAIRVSGGVLHASAIKKVEPIYPADAKAARVEGPVRIHVIVSKDGKVTEASFIDGHPLLREAALQAARQWEFEPIKHSGLPAKIVGVLTFQFTLQ